MKPAARIAWRALSGVWDRMATNQETQSPILELRGISKSYGNALLAVNGVDLAVFRGEFLSLLGPSGCGKTTILRMLAGFETPTAGQIVVGGHDFTNVPPHRRGMSMVFQNYALFPHRTVFENVSFGLRMQKLDRPTITDKVAKALSMVALSGLETRKPSQLSGGQQQRVALARALVVEPKVLLCDEPLAALDKKLRQSMQVELKQLQRRLNVTLIFVTHDQEEALAMSDRVAVMDRGRIEQLGTPAEIYNVPATSFTADFIGDTNLFKGRIEQRDGACYLLAGTDLALHLPAFSESVAPVAVALRPEKITLSSIVNGTDGQILGTVENVLFQGQSVLFHVVTSDGVKIVVREANDGGPLRYQPGERIALTWKKEDITPLWQ